MKMGQPINPYVAGAPLRGERGFFGRQDTLDWVARELRNLATNALVLFGQRRIGKTTLLLQLQRTLPADAFLPIYFDLQDQATRPLGQVLADLADTVTEWADLEPPDPAADDGRGRFFIRVFLPHLYHALRESRRPVFLLDEFDVLDWAAEAELPETAAAKALLPFLRRVMTEDPRPAFVFVVGRRAEDLSLDFTATFKASLVREIWVLDRESAEALVRQAEANNTLCFTDRAVARILSLTSGHPYLTQLLCQRVWERAYAGNPAAPPRIDVSEVEAAVPDALEAGDQALVWLWNGLSPAEKIYAAALAEAADEGETISEDQVIRVLTAHAARLRTREVELAPRDLVKRRVLEQVGERKYRFAVELFRHWLRHHKPLQDVKDELDQVSPLAEQLFGVGQGFFRRRQWETSIRYFRDALEVYPGHFRARLHLGEGLLELGQTDEAVAELEPAYELDREEARLPLARALVALARVREKAGDESAALAACEQALQISPNERVAQELVAAIWTRRGDAALERGDLEAALDAYRATGITEKITQVGDVALERGDLETALTVYREAAAVEKIIQVEVLQQRRVLAGLEAQAQARARTERWAEAAAVCEQLVARVPDEETRAVWQAALEWCQEQEELTRLFAEGVEALEEEDWKQAQRAFLQVISRRVDYQKGGHRATELLDQATKMGSSIPTFVQPPTLPLILKPVISAGNADRVTQLARWGVGRAVWSVAFSPDGATLALGTDNTVQLWRVSDGKLLRTLEGHTESVWSVAFSPDGATLTSGAGNTVQLWRVSDGRLLRTLEGHTESVWNVAFSPDGATLASTSGDRTVRLWPVIDGARGHIFKTLALDVSFSNDGATMFSVSDLNIVRMWRVSDGALLRTQEMHPVGAELCGATFSPDCETLASVHRVGGTVWLGQVDDGTLLRELNTSGVIMSVSFSPDGVLLASGSDDGTVRLWRVSDGALLRTLEGHIRWMHSVAFSPDGVLLASGSPEGIVWLWGVAGD